MAPFCRRALESEACHVCFGTPSDSGARVWVRQVYSRQLTSPDRAGLDREVPIVLQKSPEGMPGARIESQAHTRRIEVAKIRSAANQCCAPQSAKYFCNTICH